MSQTNDRGSLEGTARSYLAALDRLDLEGTMACFADGASFGIGSDGTQLRGREPIRAMWDGILGAHRAMTHEVTDIAVDAERGKVMTRQSFHGWEADGNETERASAYLFTVDPDLRFTDVQVWIDGSTPGTGSGGAMTAPRVGWGSSPALLLVDFARGWTDPQSPISLPLDDQLDCAARLLAATRAAGAPVVFVTSAYEPAELGTVRMLQKTPRVRVLTMGSTEVEIDPRIEPGPEELVIIKKHGSAFFATELASYLVTQGVDTVMIGGCITSGCVRASAVDAAQHGFRSIVVGDACGDRTVADHEASLQSIDDLYGDVVSTAEALTYLESAEV
jgi:maleamate amidohydrolase